MAMQKQAWSISALSVELGLDRRTLAKRLEDCPAVEITGTSKKYRMADVIDHLDLMDNSRGYKEREIEERTYQFLRDSTAALFDDYAEMFMIYMWRGFAPFPAFQADHVLGAVDALWKIQMVALGRKLGGGDKIPTPPIIDMINDPKERETVTKWLEKVDRVWPDMLEEMNSKKNGKTKKKGGTK